MISLTITREIAHRPMMRKTRRDCYSSVVLLISPSKPWFTMQLSFIFEDGSSLLIHSHCCAEQTRRLLKDKRQLVSLCEKSETFWWEVIWLSLYMHVWHFRQSCTFNWHAAQKLKDWSLARRTGYANLSIHCRTIYWPLKSQPIQRFQISQ